MDFYLNKRLPAIERNAASEKAAANEASSVGSKSGEGEQ